MKPTPLILTLILAATALLHAEEPGHDHDPIKAPHGGRMLELTGHRHAEFLVTTERRVEVRFYDAGIKPLDLPGAVVEVVAQAEAGSGKLSLAPYDGVHRSAEPLPLGDPYPLVLRVKPSPDASYENLRFTFDNHICSGCQKGEYACTCEGHDH